MRHGWLAISLLCGLCLVPSSFINQVGAGPPQIGQSQNSWWPSMPSWKMPWSAAEDAAGSRSKAASKEPSFIQSTRIGLNRAWTGTKRATGSAWSTTKNVFRPYDPPQTRTTPAGRTYREPEQEGFWAGLFGKSEPEPKPITVNDFLKQPTPY